MKRAPFGYVNRYNPHLKRESYIVNEDQYLTVRDSFIDVCKSVPLEKLVRVLNDCEFKTSSGLPYSKTSFKRMISDPAYINLVETNVNGELRYVVELYESIITVEEWVLAQVAIENFDALKHPDIRSHIYNSNYNQPALNDFVVRGIDTDTYMLEYKGDFIYF